MNIINNYESDDRNEGDVDNIKSNNNNNTNNNKDKTTFLLYTTV